MNIIRKVKLCFYKYRLLSNVLIRTLWPNRIGRRRQQFSWKLPENVVAQRAVATRSMVRQDLSVDVEYRCMWLLAVKIRKYPNIK